MWATSVTKQIEKKSKTSIPLEKHVANMRQYFVQQRQDIPNLEEKCMDLEARKNDMTSRYQTRIKMDLGIEIQQLREEIDIRRAMTREHEYEQTIAPYLSAYNQRVEVEEVSKDAPRNITAPGCGKKRETIDTYVQQSDATAIRQTTLVNEYLMETNGEPPKLALNTRDECPLCHNDLVLINSNSSWSMRQMSIFAFGVETLCSMT